MKWVLKIEEIESQDDGAVGGKASALARLAREGLTVPPTVSVPAAVYRHFVETTGLQARVLTELNRKPFKAMRWEEIWDCALRIRNMFLNTPLPSQMSAELAEAMADTFGNRPVAVRSSAPGEDSAQASFAGLHESYLNIRGPSEILSHIRLVWASLWSDAALLYRQELGLDARRSTMAVVVQGLEEGRCSGVFFSKNPNDGEQSVIEAVYGLNQGLVDGQIPPDRWIIERSSNRLISHNSGERQQRMVAGVLGVETEALPASLARQSPLTEDDIAQVLEAGCQAEDIFGSPQDVEWTFTTKGLVILQSRPITSGESSAQGDKRVWYLSLHRSFENLKALEAKISRHLIPEMIQVSGAMANTDLVALSPGELAAEIQHRRQVNDHWVQVYWADFIPFAHGMRLFGQFYNDVVQPEDPFEFMGLLEKSDLVSVKRNELLAQMAQMVTEDMALGQRLSAGDDPPEDGAFANHLETFIEQFGDLTCPVTGGDQCRQGPQAIIRIVLELAAGAKAAQPPTVRKDPIKLQEKYLAELEGERRQYGEALLKLGRSSYKLRDDDNIHLGRIEAHFFAALREARSRLDDTAGKRLTELQRKGLETALDEFEIPPTPSPKDRKPEPVAGRLKARQIVGQPAGPGLATGKARVVQSHDDLLDFKHNEILICDAVDPNMTFIVPLVAAVVERRGGMLIHGAIIAREYGIPCVTGVPDAHRLIHTGDRVTVDGYLGLVTLGSDAL